MPVTPARVLIVDDSAVARAVLANAIDQSPRIAVARTVANAAAALAFLAQERVAFILLDIEMPGIDGLTALPDLIAAADGAKIVVVSSTASAGAANTLQALALGAADTLFKPSAGESTSRFAATLVDTLVRLGEPVRLCAVPARAPVVSTSPDGADAFDIIAIGASTGGIHALGQLLREIPASFQLPIIVTQHLPASFMPYFAGQLAVLGARPCEVAVDRLRIRAGRIIVAPGDAHLRCVALSDGGAAIRLSTDPAASGCLPSVDPMLASLAGVYGRRLLAVVLSGMGRDGADGARAVHDSGGCVVAQDQATSVVWGMPGAVAATGCADALLGPEAIGRLIASGRRA